MNKKTIGWTVAVCALSGYMALADDTRPPATPEKDKVISSGKVDEKVAKNIDTGKLVPAEQFAFDETVNSTPSAPSDEAAVGNSNNNEENLTTNAVQPWRRGFGFRGGFFPRFFHRPFFWPYFGSYGYGYGYPYYASYPYYGGYYGYGYPSYGYGYPYYGGYYGGGWGRFGRFGRFGHHHGRWGRWSPSAENPNVAAEAPNAADNSAASAADNGTPPATMPHTVACFARDAQDGLFQATALDVGVANKASVEACGPGGCQPLGCGQTS